jgi:hypothetical protein
VAQVTSLLPNGTILDDITSVSCDQSNQDVGASISTTSIILLSAPIVVGGTPAFGTGSSQSFTFQFSHIAGYRNLEVVNVLISSALDGRSACYLAYSIPSSTLFLVNDAGQAGGPFAGAVQPGDSSTIQNSQCSVNLVSATGNAGTLTLVVSISFKPSFGGNRIVFVAARDQGAGNTGWQPLGVWQAPFTSPVNITISGLSPARVVRSAGQNVQITLSLTDTDGAGGFGIVNILVNQFIDGRKACYLAYSAAANTLFLVDDQGDAGGPFAGSMLLNGTNAGIQNGQCAVNASGSSVSYAANSLSLTLNITFTSSFNGNRVIYAAGRDRSEKNNTGWQAAGTVTIQ